MTKKPSLGEQELDALHYVIEHAPASVGEVAEGFGAPRGLARSTVKTMMERLRKKGYLVRKIQDGVFCYSPPVGEEEILSSVVQQFVERTLAGSAAPVVAYFSKKGQVSDEELAELQRLVAELEARRKGRAE